MHIITVNICATRAAAIEVATVNYTAMVTTGLAVALPNWQGPWR